VGLRGQKAVETDLVLPGRWYERGESAKKGHGLENDFGLPPLRRGYEYGRRRR
jgi:hypothetical protein